MRQPIRLHVSPCVATTQSHCYLLSFLMLVCKPAKNSKRISPGAMRLETTGSKHLHSCFCSSHIVAGLEQKASRRWKIFPERMLRGLEHWVASINESVQIKQVALLMLHLAFATRKTQFMHTEKTVMLRVHKKRCTTELVLTCRCSHGNIAQQK